MQNVSVSYSKNVVLHNVSISIPKRQTIAFIGESGSGKTTLVNIVMGLIQPDSGIVIVDGSPLNEFNLET